MVKLIYSNASLRDIENIKEFISTDSVSKANRFIKSIRERITLLKQHPEAGSPVYPERFKNLRNSYLNPTGVFINIQLIK